MLQRYRMLKRLRRAGTITFSPAGPAVIDGEPWVPELSPDGFVGIYFQWQAATVHMYAVCQSYLPKACLEFSTLVSD
jgi:hypothetical protein